MKTSTPLVSICMPCHNAARHLPEALESVFGQSYGNIEVIAVNDSSTDGTGELLETIGRSKRLQVIHASAGNAAKSRNLAFAQARGEFIKYFDADDILSPDLIQKQVERLVDRTDCIASSRWKRFRISLTEREFAPDGTWQDLDSVDWLLESMRGGGHQAMMQCGMFLIPRGTIEKHGGWDERLSLIDDTEFFGRMITGCRQVLFTEGALYYRSAIPGSLSTRKSREAYESAVRSIQGFCDHLLASEDSERTRRVAADLCQAYVYEIGVSEPDLAKVLKRRVDELGGSRVHPSGGPVFHLLSNLVGWKAASRLRDFGRRLGYQRLPLR